MPNLYVKDSAWRRISRLFLNVAGSFTPIRKVYINDGGTWRLVFGTDATGYSVSVAGSGSFTIPDGVYTMLVGICGGGGGGGAADQGGDNDNLRGSGGGGANLVFQSFNVLPGEVYDYVIGSGGLQGVAYGDVTGHSGVVSTLSKSAVTLMTGAAGGGGQYRARPGGAGANGANDGVVQGAGGTSTNGGSNGGAGSPTGYYSSGYPGQDGKLVVTW